VGSAIQLTPMIAMSAFFVGYGLGWVVMKKMSQGAFRKPQAASRLRAAVRWFVVGHEPPQGRHSEAA
jgi:hypothetical protein